MRKQTYCEHDHFTSPASECFYTSSDLRCATLEDQQWVSLLLAVAYPSIQEKLRRTGATNLADVIGAVGRPKKDPDPTRVSEKTGRDLRYRSRSCRDQLLTVNQQLLICRPLAIPSKLQAQERGNLRNRFGSNDSFDRQPVVTWTECLQTGSVYQPIRDTNRSGEGRRGPT